MCEKNITISNPSTCVCEINRYLKSLADDLVDICDEIIDMVAKSYDKTTNFNDKKVT